MGFDDCEFGGVLAGIWKRYLVWAQEMAFVVVAADWSEERRRLVRQLCFIVSVFESGLIIILKSSPSRLLSYLARILYEGI